MDIRMERGVRARPFSRGEKKVDDRDSSSTPAFNPCPYSTTVGPIELLDARDAVRTQRFCRLRSATDETISTLSAILGDMVIAAHPRRSLHMEHDHRFHAALATATGNAALLQVIETLWAMRANRSMCNCQNHFHNEVIWQQAILEHRGYSGKR